MTILFVDSVSDIRGGAERSLLELAAALAGRGHTVALAAWRDGELADGFRNLGRVSVRGAAADPASPLGGVTTRAPLLRPVVRAANWLRLWLRPVSGEAGWLEAAIRETGATIVHTNCDLSLPAALRATRAAGVPMVAHVRDDWRSWFHPRTARALRSAAAVVAPSAFLAGRFRARGLDSVIVANPVAGRAFRRQLSPEDRRAIRRGLGLGAGAFAAAVVGRLDEQKGTLRVLEAARKLDDRGDARVRLLIAGKGNRPFEARLRAAVDSLERSDRVRLLGYRADVSDWLPAMDALIVPSLGEPFGRMIIEGMHAGLPVLAFRDGAAPEILDHGRTGLLLPPGDTDALADGLLQLAGKPRRAGELGASARDAARRYEPDIVAGAMERIYEELAGG